MYVLIIIAILANGDVNGNMPVPAYPSAEVCEAAANDVVDAWITQSGIGAEQKPRVLHLCAEVDLGKPA